MVLNLTILTCKSLHVKMSFSTALIVPNTPNPNGLKKNRVHLLRNCLNKIKQTIQTLINSWHTYITGQHYETFTEIPFNRKIRTRSDNLVNNDFVDKR